jgi:hypothetical protein
MSEIAEGSRLAGGVEPQPGSSGFWLSSWLSLRALGRVLWLTRFSVAPLIIGAYAFLMNDETQEVLREFAARDGFWGDIAELLTFAFAILLWAWNTWLCARLLTSLRLPEAPAPLLHEHFYRVWAPRVLGWAAALVVPIAMLIASTPYIGHSYESVRQMWIMSALLFAGAAVFVAWTLGRRRILGARLTRDVDVVASGTLTARELPWFEKGSFLATIAFTLFLFFYFWIGQPEPSPLGQTGPERTLVYGWVPLGAAAILLAALAAWIPFGSALVYVSALWHRMPLFALLLLAALAFSPFNDNHVVRMLDATAARSATAIAASAMEDCSLPQPEVTAPARRALRYPVCAYARKWLAARRHEVMSSSEPYPVYLVAAAGGGIRAAYWTAGLLAFRQDNDPGFAHHAFALSGVSGGSLGSVVFAGLLHEQQAAARQGKLAGCDGTFSEQKLTSCATAMLAGDFLAPTLGAMLYPDLVQRFLPVALPGMDRAQALERAWESRWTKVMHDTWLGSSYESVASPDPASDMPLLFLNTTSVEDGKRALVSPLPVAPLEFPDTIDVRSIVPRPIRFSTATHLSARFTYVSPAATVRDASGSAWGHLVDGGYFENSGAATLLDVAAALEKAARELDLAQRIVPVVLLIANDPFGAKPSEDPAASARYPMSFAVELRAPPLALLQTREGRGTEAQAVLKRSVEWRGADMPPGRFEFYQPADTGVPLPLGWMLSPSARDALDRQIIVQSLRGGLAP